MRTSAYQIADHLRNINAPAFCGRETVATDFLDVAQTQDAVTITPKYFCQNEPETRSRQLEFLVEAGRFFSGVRRDMSLGRPELRYHDRAAFWGVRNMANYRHAWTVRGYDHLALGSQYVFAPVHACEMDFAQYHFLLHAFHPGFVMKFGLGASFYIGAALRSVPWNYLVDRSDPGQAYAELGRAAKRLWSTGESAVIFPHGEYPGPPLKSPDDDGDLFDRRGKSQGQLKRGVAVLAVNSGLPVVPIIANGLSRAFRYVPGPFRNFRENALKNARIEVIIDKPIDPNALSGTFEDRVSAILARLENSYRENYSAPLS